MILSFLGSKLSGYLAGAVVLLALGAYGAHRWDAAAIDRMKVAQAEQVARENAAAAERLRQHDAAAAAIIADLTTKAQAANSQAEQLKEKLRHVQVTHSCVDSPAGRAFFGSVH